MLQLFRVAGLWEDASYLILLFLSLNIISTELVCVLRMTRPVTPSGTSLASFVFASV